MSRKFRRIMKNKYFNKANTYLNMFCNVKPNRRTGSLGNREATDFFANVVEGFHYIIDNTSFPCIDYETGKVSLVCNDRTYNVYISPFSQKCDVIAKLAAVSTLEQLNNCQCKENILLMQGPLCSEQLMPKNFVFYNPDHHKRIYKLLEEKQPKAIITATKKNPELVGALYPFPMIEDGDFDIPSVYCTDTVGKDIAAKTGEVYRLQISAKRIPTTACNIVAKQNPDLPQKIVFCAHIDAYWCTPGALDDASGIVVLLLLAEMLQSYKGKVGIEIVAFNGEDYYSAGGQMDYLHRYGKDLNKMIVAINLDDIGYKQGKTSYSLYECPEEIKQKAHKTFSNRTGILAGKQWYQGDHMIFSQNGKPAIAFTSEKVADLLSMITHTPKDKPEIVDCWKLVEIADALQEFFYQFQ
jgi:aminopeptidase YwaD